MISQRFCFYKNSFSEKADAEDGWRTDDTDLWIDKDLIAFKNILVTSLVYICRIIGWEHIFAYIISSSSNLASFILIRNLCSNSEYNQNTAGTLWRTPWSVQSWETVHDTTTLPWSPWPERIQQLRGDHRTPWWIVLCTRSCPSVSYWQDMRIWRCWRIWREDKEELLRWWSQSENNAPLQSGPVRGTEKLCSLR